MISSFEAYALLTFAKTGVSKLVSNAKPLQTLKFAGSGSGATKIVTVVFVGPSVNRPVVEARCNIGPSAMLTISASNATKRNLLKDREGCSKAERLC
ncbi:hypothetical protein RRF57_001480 [Xylaria bambusicola]|uniref:Uncharacterized protein n=1 Tax=Xylaria bambusicola TaxID=326684 RepID=A0AAN7UBK6_9PEZI